MPSEVQDQPAVTTPLPQDRPQAPKPKSDAPKRKRKIRKRPSFKEIVEQLPMAILLLLRAAAGATKKLKKVEKGHITEEEYRRLDSRADTKQLRKVVEAMVILDNFLVRNEWQKRNVVFARGLTDIYKMDREQYAESGERKIKDMFIENEQPLGNTAETVNRQLRRIVESYRLSQKRTGEGDRAQTDAMTAAREIVPKVLEIQTRLVPGENVGSVQIKNQLKARASSMPSRYLGPTFHRQRVEPSDALKYALSKVFAWPDSAGQGWPPKEKARRDKLVRHYKQVEKERRRSQRKEQMRLIDNADPKGPPVSPNAQGLVSVAKK